MPLNGTFQFVEGDKTMDATPEQKKSNRTKKSKKLVQTKSGQFSLDLGKTQTEQLLEGGCCILSPENTESICASFEKARMNSSLIDPKRSVVMSNEFVVGIEEGKSLASRLVRVAIGAIPMNATELPATKITTDDFAGLNLTSQRLTGHSRAVLEEILSYRIILVSMDKLADNQKLTGINVFSYATLIPKEGAIVVQLNPVLKEHFLELRSDFTQYKLEEIVQLKTFPAIKLHELLLSYSRKYNNPLVRFHLHTLSMLLRYEPKSDFVPSTFYNSCVKRALKEINEHTSIQVQAVPVYPLKSKAYTDVRFYIDARWDTLEEKQKCLEREDRIRNGPACSEKAIITAADKEIEQLLQTGEGELCPEDIRSNKPNYLQLR